MKKYWIKVTRNNQSKIISLFSPDFNIEFLDPNNNEDVSDFYREYIIDTLINHLVENGDHRDPKKLKHLKSIPLSVLEHWEAFEIDLKNKCGCFSRTLPILGQVSNILAIITGAFVTYMALQITSRNVNNDNENSTSFMTLSIVGAVLNSIVNLLLFTYSGASVMLGAIGKSIDHLFCKRSRRNDEILSERAAENNQILSSTNQCRACCQKISWPLLGVSTLAIGCVAANALVVGTKQYQEITLVAGKYLNLYPDLTPNERERYFNLLMWLVAKLYTLTMAFRGLAFQGSFASRLIKKLMDRLEQRRVSRTVNSENGSQEQEYQLSDESPLISSLSRVTDTLSHSGEQNEMNEDQNVELVLYDFKATIGDEKKQKNLCPEEVPQDLNLGMQLN